MTDNKAKVNQIMSLVRENEYLHKDIVAKMIADQFGVLFSDAETIIFLWAMNDRARIEEILNKTIYI